MMRRNLVFIPFVFSLAVCISGCLESSECEITRDGLTRVECPGGFIETSEDVPDGARCVEVEGGVACDSGQDFEFDRATADEGTFDEPDDSMAPVFGPAGYDEETGQNGYGCVVTDGVAECSDGSTAENVPSGSNCRSENVPGVGRRIVCGEEEFLPMDENGNPVPSATPSCELIELSDEETLLSCSEGTSVLGTQAELADCEPKNATIETNDDGSLSIVCGSFEEVFPEDGRCRYPNGLVVETLEKSVEVATRGCRWIYGDVTARGLSGLSFLRGVDTISGVLLVEDMPEMTEFDQVGDGLRLFEVGGLVVQSNDNLRFVDELPELRRISGQLLVTGNESVETFVVPVRHIEGAFIVASNEKLELFERPDLKNDVPLFMFIDNTSYSWCDAATVWEWAGENATSIYIGNTAPPDDC